MRRGRDGYGLRNDEINHHGTGGRHCCEELEEPTPAHPIEQMFDGRRCGDRTQRAEHDHIAVDERDALPWKPQNDGFQARHQCGCNPEPDHCARDHEPNKCLRHAEQHGAGGRDQQQHALNSPRAIAIQQHADRNLSRCEGQEVDGGEQPEVCCAERQIRRQMGRDRRVDRAEQVGKIIPGGKR